MSKRPHNLVDWVHRLKNYGAGQTHLRVCEWRKQGDVDIALYCGFIPDELVEKSLERVTWDLLVGDGGPTIWTSQSEHGYEPNSSAPYQPLIHVRTFHGIRPNYIEISEEFRLFFDLYHFPSEQKLIRIDNGGNEHDAVIYTTHEKDGHLSADISRKLLDEFCLVKNVHLAIFFEIGRDLESTFEELGVYPKDKKDYNEDLFRAEQFYFQFAGSKRCARLIGKRLFPGRARTDKGPWELYDETEEFEEFIVGVDDQGKHIKVSCKPQDIRQDASLFYAPVYFRKEVLSKYYNHPERYEVQDGWLSCGSLWGLRMDNDHQDHISVLLGDLGTSLEHSEQLYWRSHNFWPTNPGLSTSAFRRGVLGEFTSPDSVQHRFKEQFAQFNRAYTSSQVQDFFLPLGDGDEYILTALSVPIIPSQAEFDKQVLLLCKLLVDSLSEKEIERRIQALPDIEEGLPRPAGEGKTIQNLENLLTLTGAPEPRESLEVFRELQALRSSSAAHRKAKHYQNVAEKLEIKEKGTILTFKEILQGCIALLEYLERNLC